MKGWTPALNRPTPRAYHPGPLRASPPAYPVGESEIEQHALRHDAAHFPRLQIDYEQRLPSVDLLRLGALLLHAGENDALVIAEADAELQQLVGVRHIVHGQNRAHADVELVQHCRRDVRFNGSGNHSRPSIARLALWPDAACKNRRSRAAQAGCRDRARSAAGTDSRCSAALADC